MSDVEQKPDSDLYFEWSKSFEGMDCTYQEFLESEVNRTRRQMVEGKDMPLEKQYQEYREKAWEKGMAALNYIHWVHHLAQGYKGQWF